jgi:hypothetical protein
MPSFPANGIFGIAAGRCGSAAAPNHSIHRNGEWNGGSAGAGTAAGGSSNGEGAPDFLERELGENLTFLARSSELT